MSVYTVVDANDLAEFLQHYDVGTLESFEGISAGIENTNYFVNTNHNGTIKRFVLTIFEHHSFDELPYFLNIMAFMAEHQIPTAHPVATKNTTYLQPLKNKPAALVARLSGSGVEEPTLTQCEVMGQKLAQFHLAGAEFSEHRKNDRDLSWMKNTFELIQSKLPADEKSLVEAELAFQDQIDWQPLPAGVIHADLFCDNALFNGDELSGIIDLYYACNSTLLYDLAVMVNDWCRIHSDTVSAIAFDSQKIEGMLKAYQSVRELTSQELETWPAALRLAALRFFLSRLKDKHIPREGEMTQIKDPNVFKTILKIHQKR